MISLSQLGKQIENCDRKSTYPTRLKAIAFADNKGWKQHPYECPVCGLWHLTSQGEDQ